MTKKKTTKAATTKSKSKAAKKTSKKTPVEKAVKKAVKKETANGPTPAQVKVLKVLAKGKAALNRVELSKRTSINGGWSKLLGAGTRDELGVQGGGLAGMGLVAIEGVDGSRILTYRITAKGRQVAAKS